MDEEQIEALAAGAEYDGPEDVATPEPEEAEPEEGTTQDTAEDEVEASADEDQNDEEAEPEDWREKRLAKMTHKQKRAEEKLREYEAELAKYKEQKSAQTQALPEVPDYPSADLQYDDPKEWQRQLQEREQALVKRAQAEYQQKLQQEQSQAKQTEAQKAQQAELQSIVEKYTASGLEAGISNDKMAYNEEVLMDAGINADLAKYLYSDAKGAQLVDYLASTPAELGKLAKMSPYAAVEYIATAVKPKAGVTRSKATKAPDPARRTNGTGSAQKDDFDKLLPAGYSID